MASEILVNIVSDSGLSTVRRNPLPEPILAYFQLDPQEQILVQFE